MNIQRTVQILKKAVVMASVLSGGLTASAATTYWDGNLSTAWDTTTLNWKDAASGGAATNFTAGDSVVFGVTNLVPTTQTVVVDPAGVSVGLFTISSGAGSWLFSGGKITASIGNSHTISIDTTFSNMTVNLTRSGGGVQSGVTLNKNVTLTSSTPVTNVWIGPSFSFLLSPGKALTLAGYAILDANKIASRSANLGTIIINDNAVLLGSAFGENNYDDTVLQPIDLNDGALYAKKLTGDGGGIALTWSGGVVRPRDGTGLISTANALGAISTFTLDGPGGGTFDGRDFAGAPSTITIDNAITELGGSYGVTLTGGGTLTLNGTSTYSGGTTVSAGTLDFGNLAAIPASGTVSVSASGALALCVGDTGFFSSANVDSLWANSLTGVSMDSASGVGIDTTVRNFTYSTAQSTRRLVKLGANTLTLSGANTYSGGTTVAAGTLDFQNTGAKPSSGTVTVSAGATLALGVATSGSYFTSANVDSLFANALSDVSMDPTAGVGIDTSAGDFSYPSTALTSARRLTKLGANVLTIGVANPSFTGPTVINQGTLKFGVNAALRANAASKVTINGVDANGAGTTATLDLNGKNGILTPTFGGPGGTSTSVNQLTTGAGILTTASITTDATGNPTTAASLSGKVALSAATTITVADSAGSAIDLDFSAVISSTTIARSITKSGAGTLSLSGANTYVGQTIIGEGVLSINSIGNVGGAVANSLGQPATAQATINMGAAGTAATLIYTGPTGSSDRPIALTTDTLGATIQADGTGPLTLSGGITATALGGAKILTLQGTNTGANTISGVIADTYTNNVFGGKVSITKAGTGKWVLSGANTNSGGTTINNGILAAGCDKALATGSALTLGGGTFDAGSFSNALGTLTVGTTGTLTVHEGCRLSFTGMSGAGSLVIGGTLGATALRFGTDSNGLSLVQQAQITMVNGSGVYLDAQGYVLAKKKGTMVRFF